MTALLPLYLISGYLAAGKTTLINRLIARPGAGRPCVIVNDFGGLNIDAHILDRANGITLPIANGCVCCSASAGLYKALCTALNLDPAPSCIVLEASGVSDPARIAAVALAEPELAPGGIVTLVDPTRLQAHLDDPYAAPDVTRQIAAANNLLVSRADVATDEMMNRTRRLLAGIAPATPAFDARSVRSMGDLAGLSAVDEWPETPLNTEPTTTRRYTSFTFQGKCLHDPQTFMAMIRAMEHPPARLKGLVRIAEGDRFHSIDSSDGTIRLHAVDLEHPPDTSAVTVIIRNEPGGPSPIASLVRRFLY